MSIHANDRRFERPKSTTGAVLDAESRFAARSAVHGTVAGREADDSATNNTDAELTQSRSTATSRDSKRGLVAGAAVAGLAVVGLFVPQTINGFRSFFGDKAPMAAADSEPTPYIQRSDSEGYIAVHQPAACTETLANLGATTLTGAAQVLDQRYQDGKADGSLEALRNDMSDQLRSAGLDSSEISKNTAETFEFELAQGFCTPEADRPENFGANPVGE